MAASVQVQRVQPRILAAVRRAVAPGAVGAAWGPALAKVWDFIRSQPGLWTEGHNIFLYHHPQESGALILCDFGVEVVRTFPTAGEVDRNAGWRSRHRRPPGTVQPDERGVRRHQRVDGGEPQGVCRTVVGDLRRSHAGSGGHGDDGGASLKVTIEDVLSLKDT